MQDKRGRELLGYPEFLSLFYQARERMSKMNVPLEAGFIEIGLNKYKHWFFRICDRWNLADVSEIGAFDRWVKNYDGVS
jgi:hypothetical protein